MILEGLALSKANDFFVSISMGIAVSMLLFGCGSARSVSHVLDDESEDLPAIAPLFLDPTVVSLRLEFPFTTLHENRDSLDAVYSKVFLIHDGFKVPILVKTRGRTSLASCKFPKLKIKFDKDNSEGIKKDETFLQNARAIKIGTHCDHVDPGPNQIGTEKAVKREQLAYQLYSVRSEPAFRTRRARIEYIDTDRGTENIGSRDAFLIENIKDVAERHNLEEFEFSDDQESRLENIHMWRSKLNLQATVNVILSHIMLFTTDWNIMGYNRHHSATIRNTKFLDSPSGLIPVPYDFDLTFAINDNMQEIIDVLSTTISEVPANFRTNEPGLIRSQLWLISEQEVNFSKETIISALDKIGNRRQILVNTIKSSDLSGLIKSNYLLLIESFFEASSIYRGE